MAEQTIP